MSVLRVCLCEKCSPCQLLQGRHAAPLSPLTLPSPDSSWRALRFESLSLDSKGPQQQSGWQLHLSQSRSNSARWTCLCFSPQVPLLGPELSEANNVVTVHARFCGWSPPPPSPPSPSPPQSPPHPRAPPTPPQECVLTSNGIDYRGHLSVTVGNHTCLLWTLPPLTGPDERLYNRYGSVLRPAVNYCRNPDNDVSPWCVGLRSPCHAQPSPASPQLHPYFIRRPRRICFSWSSLRAVS